MDVFDLPQEGSGTPVPLPPCPCGADRTERSIPMPLLADVRQSSLGFLERAFIQVRCCLECGTLFVPLESHTAQ